MCNTQRACGDATMDWTHVHERTRRDGQSQTFTLALAHWKARVTLLTHLLLSALHVVGWAASSSARTCLPAISIVLAPFARRWFYHRVCTRCDYG